MPGYGDQGPEVAQLQQDMIDDGFSPGAVDGVWGPQTQAAYEQWIAAGGAPHNAGGGGGGGAAPAAAATADPATLARQMYGYLGGYLNHPELGPILQQGAREGWTTERLQAALMSTNWWKSTSQVARQWGLLKTSDPAEATRQVQAQVGTLRTLVNTEGFGDQFSDADLNALAEQFLMTGVQGDAVRPFLFAHVKYQGVGAPVGTAGVNMDLVKARAADFLYPMTDETAFDWARKISTGQTTLDSFEVTMRNQAMSQYAYDKHITDAVSGGQTLKQVFDPYIQQAAGLLEQSPSTINLQDPKFQKMVDFVDSTGQRRAMTIAEAGDYVRSTNDWQTTDNARGAAASAAEQILRAFGKVSV
jgi:peptidoglycan hydrolase-like protein with peptidoglycan-binding domain